MLGGVTAGDVATACLGVVGDGANAARAMGTCDWRSGVQMTTGSTALRSSKIPGADLRRSTALLVSSEVCLRHAVLLPSAAGHWHTEALLDISFDRWRMKTLLSSGNDL